MGCVSGLLVFLNQLARGRARTRTLALGKLPYPVCVHSGLLWDEEWDSGPVGPGEGGRVRCRIWQEVGEFLCPTAVPVPHPTGRRTTPQCLITTSRRAGWTSVRCTWHMSGRPAVPTASSLRRLCSPAGLRGGPSCSPTHPGGPSSPQPSQSQCLHQASVLFTPHQKYLFCGSCPCHMPGGPRVTSCPALGTLGAIVGLQT